MSTVHVTMVRFASWMTLSGDEALLTSYIGNPLFPWMLVRRRQLFEALVGRDDPHTVRIKLEASLGWKFESVSGFRRGDRRGETHTYTTP